MKIPFKTQTVDGVESVMDVSDLNPTEIRFNQKTKEIFIVCKNKPAESGRVKNATKRKAR